MYPINVITKMLLLGIYSKKPKTWIQKNVSTPMCTAVPLTTAKIWKPSQGPLVDEWSKSCGIFTQWNTTQP